MLMSLSQRYVFLANGKSASTSFETAYGPDCEIASANNIQAGLHPDTKGAGKHIKYRTFLKLFDKFFRAFLPVRHYFVFGIMRDPMKRIQSQYRYWTRPTTAARNRLPEEMSFQNFVDAIAEKRPIDGSMRVWPQYTFFIGENGSYPINYIIKLENIHDSISTLKNVSGLDFGRAASTVRNATSSSAPPDPGVRRLVEERFARDFDLYESHTDRLLNPWDRSGELDVDAALRWMAAKANRFEIAQTLLFKLALKLEAEPDFNVSEVLALLDERDARLAEIDQERIARDAPAIGRA